MTCLCRVLQVQYPVGVELFPFLYLLSSGCWRTLSPEAKQPEHEADLSFPFSAEVWNISYFTAIPVTCTANLANRLDNF
jgi:hypothetical protein